MTTTTAACAAHPSINSLLSVVYVTLPLSGYYADPKQHKSKPWQQAQYEYIDSLLELAGVKKAEQVRLLTQRCCKRQST